MSSTDNKAGQFYFEKLVTAAEKLQARNKELLGGKPECSSYYVTRPNEPYVIELDGVSIASMLKERWEQENLSELVALVDPFMDLVSAREDEEVSDQVSPLIYQMF